MNERVGQQLGNYRLVKLLGKGGFAEVYLGQHVHLASKQAAIKILYLSDVDAHSFQQEAETTEQLVHPHIVRLLDFDVEQGTPFLVLDFAPGGSLRARHPRGSVLSLATVVAYLKELAPALQYAHDQHILHRDIKPDNLLIGYQGKLQLSDFGIAVLTQTGRTLLSAAYSIRGTPFYMAPETYRGKPEKASDQYALAVVVYEWLCGRVPFSEGDFIQLGYQHAHEPVPSLHEKNPAIPLAVEQVVCTALAKEPGQRFGSVLAFATALEQASQMKEPEPERRPIPVQPMWEIKEESSDGFELDDDLLDKAEEIVREYRRVSISLLQRRLRIGYSRAARLIDLLQQHSIIGPPESGGRHEPLASSSKDRSLATEAEDIMAEERVRNEFLRKQVEKHQNQQQFPRRPMYRDDSGANPSRRPTKLAHLLPSLRQTEGKPSVPSLPRVEAMRRPSTRAASRQSTPTFRSGVMVTKKPANLGASRRFLLLEPHHLQQIISILLLALSLLLFGALTVFRATPILRGIYGSFMAFFGWSSYLLTLGLAAFAVAHLIEGIRNRYFIRWSMVVGLICICLLMLVESRLWTSQLAVGVLAELLVAPLLGLPIVFAHLIIIGLLLGAIVVTFRSTFRQT